MSSNKWFIGLPQREDGKYELTRDEICKLLDDYEAYFKQNSHKHSVVRPEVESAKEGELLPESEGEANTCADCGIEIPIGEPCYSCEYGAMFGH